MTLGMSSRDPKPADPGGIVFNKVARDAVCVVTNRENPIQTHMTVNAVIEPSPEGAIGKSYLVYPGVQGISGDGTHNGHVGGYQDVYVKTAQGWRFKKRIHVFPPDIPGSSMSIVTRCGLGSSWARRASVASAVGQIPTTSISGSRASSRESPAA